MKGGRPIRGRGWIAAMLALVALGVSTGAPAGQVRVRDLEDRLVDPLQASAGAKAILFLFTSIDCPLSNRYAPEVRRLYERFATRGVVFRLVYANPSETPDAILDHVKAFAYPMPALRDPRHELVKLAKARVTPEAAIFERSGRLLYHGRIDDRHVGIGVEKQAATRYDLEDALAAIVEGKPVRQPAAPAVGCFLADFLR